MNDNEIIKALECCVEIGENDCQNCPYFNDVSCGCRNYENLKDALDLINRQKAEIERLKGYGAIKARFKCKHNAEAYEQLMRGEG